MQNTGSQPLIRTLDSQKNSFTYSKFFILLVVFIIVGGVLGFFLSKTSAGSTQQTGKNTDEKVEKTAGIADKKTFKDKAEGVLKEGGVDGEGNFHLERPGGESQNVYLTSTTVDLEQYINKKVRVWGETFQAEKAGWLMDVGLVELLQ